MASGRDFGLEFWWEAGGAAAGGAAAGGEAAGGAQLVFPDASLPVRRNQSTDGNVVERAMVYMAGVLDEVDDTREGAWIQRTGAGESAAGSVVGGAAGGAVGGFERGSAPQQSSSESRRLTPPRRFTPPRRLPPPRHLPPPREYAPAVHMPVLFNVRVLWEMEARWPELMSRTRAHRKREMDEIELNFFYQHYLELSGYPTARHAIKRFRVGYHPVQLCGTPWGGSVCNSTLSSDRYNFVCFNDGVNHGADGAQCELCYERGVRYLQHLLGHRFGTFGSPAGDGRVSTTLSTTRSTTHSTTPFGLQASLLRMNRAVRSRSEGNPTQKRTVVRTVAL